MTVEAKTWVSTLKPLFGWRAAITESNLPPSARHVALTLSLHMSERGDSCFPAVRTLAEETGLSKSSVQRQLAVLEEAGYLAVEHGRGRGHSSRYSAVVPEPGEMSHLGGTFAPAEMSQNDEEMSHPEEEMSHLGGTEDVITGGRKTRGRTTYSSEVNELCSAMSVRLAEMGVRKNRTRVTAAWEKDADGLLRVDGISLEDAVSVMNWATKDRFWSKNVLSPGALRRHWDRLVMECKPKARTTVPDAEHWARLSERLKEKNRLEREAAGRGETVV